ncbi:13038_t:CDS:2 [Entrophospora sp. SA101]|nr:13038_t:CDS:2 [Entrophospora sp. SA101]
MPCVFRSDLEKHRQNLLIGAAGNREGEIFSLFSAFNSESDRQKAIKFYDYIEINSPTIANHNVHYYQAEQKIIKQIVVANEGMNGAKHPLYNEATLDGKEDRFANLPDQHLRKKEEIIED